MLSAHLIAAFDFDLFWSRIVDPSSEFWGALWATIYISVLAQLGGVTLGLASALAGRSRFWPLRFINGIYVTAIRGTPLIVQIFFIYFGAELLLGVTLFPRELDIGVGVIGGAVIAGIIALALNEGAYMSEIIRAGLSSVDEGQMESSISLGMTRRQAMRHIVLPQAARIIVPPLGNQFNNMMKTSSLLAFIGVYELFKDAEQLYSVNFKPVELFAAVAFWYLVLTTIWGIFQAYLERRLDPAGAIDRGPGSFGRLMAKVRPAASIDGGKA